MNLNLEQAKKARWGYLVLGVALTGLGVYEPLVKFAGCGATVPLTGSMPSNGTI